MNSLLLLPPILIVAAAVAYGILRALGRIWLEHRVKLALLQKLETHPDLIPSFQELQDLVDSVSAQRPLRKQDLTLTGVILGFIGLGCLLWGRSFSMGRLSVGMYFGGLACVCLGFVLALVGLFLRTVARTRQGDRVGHDQEGV